MNTGKKIRMGSIFRKTTGSTVIIAADHGGIAGPLQGIDDPKKLLGDCVQGGADGVLTTRGFARAAGDEWEKSTSLILRLSGGFTVLGGKFEEEIISSVETALLYGACAAAVTVKFGHEREGEFIRRASLLADECERWGMPIMIEAKAVSKNHETNDVAAIKLAARAAAEIGADIVKTSYTGDPDSFGEVVEGCPVPIVILGGDKKDDWKTSFTDVFDAMQAGAKGIAMGRNIWQQKNVCTIIEAMTGIVHEKWPLPRATKYIEEK
jgi:DhnA family fructose-bisphosphate aldolase class Ia